MVENAKVVGSSSCTGWGGQFSHLSDKSCVGMQVSQKVFNAITEAEEDFIGGTSKEVVTESDDDPAIQKEPNITPIYMGNGIGDQEPLQGAPKGVQKDKSFF